MLTLDEAWTMCLKMWAWIFFHHCKYETVWLAKQAWLDQNNIVNIMSCCFFCEADWQVQDYPPCQHCPGKLVDIQFDCQNEDYCYSRKPEQFYQKFLQLNRKRLQK